VDIMHYLDQRRARANETKLLQTKLAADLRLRLDLGDDDLVRVGEIGCGVPGCADVETVFLLLRPKWPTEIVKIAAPMADVGPSDLDDVAVELRACCAETTSAQV